MSTIVKLLNAEEMDRLYHKLKPMGQVRKTPQYAAWMLKVQDVNVTAWKSGKVCFQGNDPEWLADSVKESGSSAASSSKKKTASKKASSGSTAYQASFEGMENDSEVYTRKPKAEDTYPQAGSDEVGTGDFIGPVVVAAVIVPDQKTADALHALHITDSKAMTDALIRKVGPQIEEMVPHSIVVLQNPLYNVVHDDRGYNMNKIKAMLHNQVYLNLRKKGYELPEICMIDQFVQPKGYFKHLEDQPEIFHGVSFQTKAESRWIAVAAASVLARYTFLKAWDQLEERYGLKLEKGGGPKATTSAKRLMDSIGKDRMKEAVKIHFANSEKIGLR